MSGQRDEMELKEEAVKAHYAGAAALLSGFDHAPRIGKAQVVETPAERSPGIGTRPRFRSTTPGLVTRSTARPEGVRLIERVEGIGGDDPIVDPVEAVVLQALRRALAIALAVGEMFSGQTGLTELKKANLESRLPEARRSEFSELLAAEALAVLSVFANATAFLLASHAGEEVVEIGAVEEVLTDNAQLALHGVLWELDQDLALFAVDAPKLVPTVLAFAEQLMEKVKLRAASAPRLEAFTGANYRVEADNFPIAGFEPARKAKGSTLVMTFKKPNEVVGNHIANQRFARASSFHTASIRARDRQGARPDNLAQGWCEFRLQRIELRRNFGVGCHPDDPRAVKVGRDVDQLAGIHVDHQVDPGEHDALAAILGQEHPVWPCRRDLDIRVVANHDIDALDSVRHINHRAGWLGQRAAERTHVPHCGHSHGASRPQAGRLVRNRLHRVDDAVRIERPGPGQSRDIGVGKADQPDCRAVQLKQERRLE